MSKTRNLTRLFFSLALFVSIGAGVRHIKAQTEVAEPAACADGNRKVCLTQPTSGGGTAYFYWV